MRRAGFSLIDLMVAVALISIGVGLWLNNPQHRRASERAVAVEGVARVVDQELERMRACPSRACLDRLATETATRAGVSAYADTWVRAKVRRTVEPGPNGTHLVTVGARVPGLLKERTASALVWVRR
jgi:type II secretory pathway pseudopilin PulG